MQENESQIVATLSYARSCISCVSKKISVPIEEVANTIESIWNVAPVEESTGICPGCGQEKILYKINYPLP